MTQKPKQGVLVKPAQVALPLDQSDRDYLAARRVRAQHSWFMHEVVDPLKKEKSYE